MTAFGNDLFKWALRLPGPPEAPPGDEGSILCFRAASNYLYYLLFRWFLGTLVSFVGLAILVLFLIGTGSTEALSIRPFYTILGVGLLILFILQSGIKLALVRLDYLNRWYLVTNRSLRIREGIREVKEITFTFANIQNLTVTQGPVQRILKIADLRVETAGGRSVDGQMTINSGSHIAFFRGINTVEEIRKVINDRMTHFRDSGLGDPDDAASVSTKRLPMNDGALLTRFSIGRDEILALRGVLAEARALRESVEERGSHPPVA